MRVRVQKWGNSLALRIPNAFASEMSLEAGSPVDLTLAEGRLVVKPEHVCYSLKELLMDVTPENLHGEVDFGKPTSKGVRSAT